MRASGVSAPSLRETNMIPPISASKWEDLKTRSLSALLMVIVGAADIWIGGIWFLVMIALVCGLMVWELVRMLDPGHKLLARGLGVLASAAVTVAISVPTVAGILALAAPVIAGAILLKGERAIYILYAPVIMLAAYALVSARALEEGITWLVWLLLVVIVTDIAGYFAGKAFGGPKFWPSISPKKTWSGTVAGWIAAALVGVAFVPLTEAGNLLILVSMITSFASQMGDIAESAIKRRMGVKDSSRLIPGHGGVLDRFDGLIGAAMLVLVIMLYFGRLPVMT